MVRAQGGDVRAVVDPERLPRARSQLEVLAPRAGVVTAIDAFELGLSSVALGAGRVRAEDAVDPAAGIEIRAPLGTRVARGEPLARLHAASRSRLDAVQKRVRDAFQVGERAAKPTSRILGRIARGAA
jgi:pyrimidine-nucleoside phosphorylase